MFGHAVTDSMTWVPTLGEISSLFGKKKLIYYPMGFQRFLDLSREPLPNEPGIPLLEMRELEQECTPEEFSSHLPGFPLELEDDRYVAPLIWWLATKRNEDVVAGRANLFVKDAQICFISNVRPGKSYVHMIPRNHKMQAGDWVVGLCRSMVRH